MTHPGVGEDRKDPPAADPEAEAEMEDGEDETTAPTGRGQTPPEREVDEDLSSRATPKE
jgi:hypothetical protein